MGFFDLMAAPFAECLVLVGIHTYLGIHVLKRRVIFVDLALAQIAALGTTVGFVFGIMPETNAALVFSMACTFVGAAIFAITRLRSEKVPQEAVIGLVYALTYAAALLVVEKTQGAEHLADILVGSILWVKWNDVAVAAGAYLFIGLIHFYFRDKFLLISNYPEKAYRQGMRVRAWDFLFYVTFGFVIAFSVKVAGVILVFVFLVAPAIMAFMITDRLIYQLLIGWGIGTLVTVIGLYLSYVVDLPSGPSVVSFYGITLVAGALIVYLVKSRTKLKALKAVSTGIAITFVIGTVLYYGAQWLATTDLAVSDMYNKAEEELHRDETAMDCRREAKAQKKTEILESLTHACVGPGKIERYAAMDDAQARLDFIRTKLAESTKKGLGFLLIFLSDPETPMFFRSEAVDLLKEATGEDFGYNTEAEPSANAEALKAICQRLKAEKRGDR
jgi:zinc/manganese transport system permease protein